MSMLEQLATSEPTARLVVQYKRLRSRILRLEAICTAVTNGKIYPLFNQIKSRAGLLTSVAPDLFINGISARLKSCFDECVHDCFADWQRSLETLSRLTQDPVLLEVRKSGRKVDALMSQHEVIKDLDHDELLLCLAAGLSDATLSRVFLIDRSKVTRIRHDLGRRYETMFKWLENYRCSAQANGYATVDDNRKYIDGLRSSDISRREKALETAVRWLIRY
jgi:DNA polymerase I-like protein with 3'-5' exonuclease and polymerase domains